MKRQIVLLVFAAACGRSGSSSEDKPTPVTAAEPKIKPSTGPYAMTITPHSELRANAPISLVLELRDGAGARVRDLDIVHDKLLHLIVVSKDLGFFAHEHPAHRADGLLDHALTLPHAGDYTVFADFTPTGAKNAVVSAQLAIAGAAPPEVALQAAPLPAEATQGAFSVALRTENPIAAGGDALLDFTIRDANGAVGDLRDYLGAKGHCVILSADRASYLHSHPMGATEGTVRFHTVFPKPGIYKLWAEFRPRGEPLRVSYTLEVPISDLATKQAPVHDDHHGHAHK